MMNGHFAIVGEITVETFRNYTLQIQRCEPAPILISSPGGNIGYMLAMLDDIDCRERTTHAIGICQSAAAVLATCGRGRRSCTADAVFRFMPVSIEERASDLRQHLQCVLIERVASRARMEMSGATLLFSGKFITASRAKERGLIDAIADQPFELSMRPKVRASPLLSSVKTPGGRKVRRSVIEHFIAARTTQGQY